MASWFESIFPDPSLRRAYISILKSAGLSGKRFEYFFVATHLATAAMARASSMSTSSTYSISMGTPSSATSIC